MKPVIWPRFPLVLLMLIDILSSSPTSTHTSLGRGRINYPSSRTASNNPRFLLEHRDLPPFHNLVDIEDLGTGWVAVSQEFQAILPMDLAADTLADFYHSIVSMCTAMVAQGTPSLPQGGTFRIGSLELVFDSVGSAVTWTLIRAFADWMMLVGDRGFISTYTFLLANYASGQVIRFRFKPRQG